MRWPQPCMMGRRALNKGWIPRQRDRKSAAPMAATSRFTSDKTFCQSFFSQRPRDTLAFPASNFNPTWRCKKKMSTLNYLRRPMALMIGMMLILSGVSWAQTQSGNLFGKAVDNNGEALPGVTVTATSPVLLAPRTVLTGANGDYVLRGLSPGGVAR